MMYVVVVVVVYFFPCICSVYHCVSLCILIVWYSCIFCIFNIMYTNYFCCVYCNFGTYVEKNYWLCSRTVTMHQLLQFKCKCFTYFALTLGRQWFAFFFIQFRDECWEYELREVQIRIYGWTLGAS